MLYARLRRRRERTLRFFVQRAYKLLEESFAAAEGKSSATAEDMSSATAEDVFLWPQKTHGNARRNV